jgi:hypothetical protein
MVSTSNVTATITPATSSIKAEKTKEYRERFRLVFEKLKVPETSFYPKILFPRNKQICLSLYKSELEKPEGFYTLIVNSAFENVDGEYKLYHYKHNPKYASEYSTLQIETEKWAVPFDHFNEVDTQLLLLNSMNNQPPAKIKSIIPYDDPTDIDSPLKDMTVRDYAAITWRIPVSNKSWLNELINELSAY